MLSPKTSIGQRPHRAMFQNPGPPVPDGDGGYTQTWTDLDPRALWVAIETASIVALERKVPAGSSLTTATHLVSGPFHPDVTTKTRVLYNGREFHVDSVTNIDERGIEMVLVCTESMP
jgi:SPP1 family predicted phage head-tail adaptor